MPQGTSATQEMDGLFGDLKAGGRAQAKKIVKEKRKARQQYLAKMRNDKKKIDPKKLPVVSLNNADLPRIVNGESTDTGKMRRSATPSARRRSTRCSTRSATSTRRVG